MVVLANWLCSDAGRLSLGVANVVRPEQEIFVSLGVDDAVLAELQAQLETEFAKVSSLGNAA